jgi:hypothetical protein
MDPKARAALATLVDKALESAKGRLELDRARAGLLEIAETRRLDRTTMDAVFRMFIEVAVWKSFGSIGASVSQPMIAGGILDAAAKRNSVAFRKWQRSTGGRRQRPARTRQVSADHTQTGHAWAGD